MYTVHSFAEIFGEIFMGGSLVASYLVLFAYRRMVALTSRQTIGGWRRYVLFYLSIAIVAPLAFPFDDVDYWRGLILFIMLTVPVLVAGAIEIAKGIHPYEVLVSFIVETVMFPPWFNLMFQCFLFLDVV